jgi:Flp pilus assembly pilin Flp
MASIDGPWGSPVRCSLDGWHLPPPHKDTRGSVIASGDRPITLAWHLETKASTCIIGVSLGARLAYHLRMNAQGQAGQGLAEYALILSLIAIIAIAALVLLGREISAILSTLGAAI